MMQTRFHAMLERFRVVLVVGLFCLSTSLQAADGLHVRVVLSDSAKPYQAFVQTFRQNVPGNIRVEVLERSEDFSGNEQGDDLIVAVGVKAAFWVADKSSTPLLAAMIPAVKYSELLEKRPRSRQISGIYLEQPWARQVDLLRAALPERKKVGVVYSAGAKVDLAALREELAGRGYTLVAKALQNPDNLFADLDDVLARSDILLAVPDSSIYSSNNIRNILLSSYRRGVPLVGLSQAYVNAGALCAIFSTPEHLATQASLAANSFAQSRRLPDIRYPQLFTVATNPEVGRSLGMHMQSVELIQMQVEKYRGKP